MGLGPLFAGLGAGAGGSVGCAPAAAGCSGLPPGAGAGAGVGTGGTPVVGRAGALRRTGWRLGCISRYSRHS